MTPVLKFMQHAETYYEGVKTVDFPFQSPLCTGKNNVFHAYEIITIGMTKYNTP